MRMKWTLSHFMSTETSNQSWERSWCCPIFCLHKIVIKYKTEVDAIQFRARKSWGTLKHLISMQYFSSISAKSVCLVLRTWLNVLCKGFIVSMSCHHRTPTHIQQISCHKTIYSHDPPHCGFTRSMPFQQLAWHIFKIVRFVMEWKKYWQQNHLPDEDLAICGSTGYMLLISRDGSTAPSVANIEARRSHGLLYLIRANVNKLEHMILATRQHLACRKASFWCSKPTSSMHVSALNPIFNLVDTFRGCLSRWSHCIDIA